LKTIESAAVIIISDAGSRPISVHFLWISAKELASTGHLSRH